MFQKIKTVAKMRLLGIDSMYTKGRGYLAYAASSRKQYKKILEMNKTPIIIGGCGRSGTTLLLSMISCHPDIYAIPKETEALVGEAYRRHTPPKNPTIRIDRIYNHICNSELSYKDKVRWCEKTPKNILYIRQILNYFGKGARFINIVRDGRDVITSRHPAKEDGFWVSPERWVNEVTHGYEFRDHPQVITVKYEDLVQGARKVIRRICAFIGEKYTSAFDDYPETATIKTSAAWDEEAKKVHSQSVGRWKKDIYQDRVEKLMKLENAEILLRHYGYKV